MHPSFLRSHAILASMKSAVHILPDWHQASAVALARLPALVEALHTRHSVTPWLGCELEWYVDKPEAAEAIAATHAAVEAQAAAQGLDITAIKPESGQGQYEVGFGITDNPQALAQAIHDFRALLEREAAAQGLQVSWQAKPHAEDYGSALQLHIHLTDAAGKRLFVKREAELSPALAASLGGLLAITPEAMLVAAPQPSSYARFVPKYDAPVTLCWGGNNRSTTLRLPLKTGPECHIEYRLAGADADPASMLAVLLAGVLHGLETQPPAGEQIHGIASDAQYALPPLPQTREEAMRLFREGSIMQRWLGEDWVKAVDAA